MTSILSYLSTLDPRSLEDDLIQLQSSWYADLDWSTENSLANASRIISDNVFARIREYQYSYLYECRDRNHECLCEINPYCVPYKNFWVAALGGHLQQKNLQDLPGFHANDWGLLSGFDYVLANWLSLGVAGGYTHSDLKWNNMTGTNSIHNFYIGPYMVLNCRCWAVEASILKGAHRYRSDRHIVFTYVNRKAKNTHYGDSITCHLGITRNSRWGLIDFMPYLTGDYIYLHVNGIKDRGANNLNLTVKRRSTQFFQGEVGVALSGTYQADNCTVVPTIKGGYQNITPFDDTKLRTRLQGQPGSFLVKTTKEPIYQWTGGLFLNIYPQDCPEIAFSYNAEWSNKRTEYCFTGEIDWSF